MQRSLQFAGAYSIQFVALHVINLTAQAAGWGRHEAVVKSERKWKNHPPTHPP